MRNGSERPTHPTGRSADPVKLAVTSEPIAVTTFLASSACLGEAQIEKTPANQAIKSGNTDELFFLHFHFTLVLYPGNRMCKCITD